MALEVHWILDRVVTTLHKQVLAVHGGEAGIRDPLLLQSALARPKNLAAYGDPPPDLAQLAAAYAHGVVKNHPFIDGNKRMGLVLLHLFLRINGYELETSQADMYEHLLGLAEGRVNEDELAGWVREKIAPRRRG
jgi:death on curing protein